MIAKSSRPVRLHSEFKINLDGIARPSLKSKGCGHSSVEECRARNSITSNEKEAISK